MALLFFCLLLVWVPIFRGCCCVWFVACCGSVLYVFSHICSFSPFIGPLLCCLCGDVCLLENTERETIFKRGLSPAVLEANLHLSPPSLLLTQQNTTTTAVWAPYLQSWQTDSVQRPGCSLEIVLSSFSLFIWKHWLASKSTRKIGALGEKFPSKTINETAFLSGPGVRSYVGQLCCTT